MGAVSNYTIQGVTIPFYQFSPVGVEMFGYTGSGKGDTAGIVNALNYEVELLMEYSTSDDFTTQQKLDFLEEAILVMTDVVADLQTHADYIFGKNYCCFNSAFPVFTNCANKCGGYSKAMIKYLLGAIETIQDSYKAKLNELIRFLELQNEQLQQDLNNQQLVAQTNIAIAEANELLLIVQALETDVREEKIESNIRLIILPLLAVGILSFLFYNAFIKK